MKKITNLTDAQKTRFPEFVEKWTKIGLSTQPADRPRAEAAIRGLYQLANLKEPHIIWCPCPISAALSAVCYAKIIQHRLVEGAKPSRKSAVDSAVRRAVGSAVGSAVDSVVYSAVGSVVYSAVDSAVRRAVDSAVYSAVDSAVYSAVDSAVGSAVGSAVRRAVDSAVGSAVDSAVGSAVDSVVYSAVDSAVRRAVDSAVYSAVDSAVRRAVDSAVYSAGTAFFGGSVWQAGYSAWADYFNEVCGIAIDRNYLETTESCGFYWTLDGICFASERPSEINLDREGRLHSEAGMSISYAGTGWGIFHWHGTQVPGGWIVDRKSLSAKKALTWKNIEQRRAALEMIGWHNVLRELNAKVIDEHSDPQCGALVEVQLPDLDRKSRFIHAQCGTRREFAIGVPPDIQTVVAAQAWLTGLPESEFEFPKLRT